MRCVQIAYRLHRMALNAKHDAFLGFCIDRCPVKIAQTANLWAVMRVRRGRRRHTNRHAGL
jgi:hypothetical protein